MTKHHHRQVNLLARISLSLSCYQSLSSIVLAVFTDYILSLPRAVLSKFFSIGQYMNDHKMGLHKITPLMCSSSHLQQFPASLVRLTWMVLEMRGKWLYSCCFQDFFNITHSILVQFSFSFFSMCFVCVHVVYPYSSIDTTAAIWSDISNFHMIDRLSIPVHALAHIDITFTW